MLTPINVWQVLIGVLYYLNDAISFINVLLMFYPPFDSLS